MADNTENSKAFNLNNLDELESGDPFDQPPSVASNLPWQSTDTDSGSKSEELPFDDELPFDNRFDTEAFTDPVDASRKEPIIAADREPDLFGETDDAPAEPDHLENLASPSFAASESAALNMSESDEGEVREIQWSTILSLLAILLSSVAIILNLTASTPMASVTDQELATYEQQARASEAQYLELKQQLDRRLRALEATQEHLGDSLQMRVKQIDAKRTEAVAAPAVTAVKKTTTTQLPAPITSNGWAVNLLSVDDKQVATKEKNRFNSLGIPAEIASFYINSVLKYRVRVSGFASKDEAATYKAKLASEHGIKDAWVYKP